MKKYTIIISAIAVVVAVITAALLIKKDVTPTVNNYEGITGSAEETVELSTEETTTAAPPELTTPVIDGLQFSSPQSSEFTTSSARTGFSGFADVNFPLYCNGTLIELSENGTFGFDVLLSSGENTYYFQNGNDEKTFTITYETDIISSVSPKGDITASSGTLITFSASGKSGCNVFVTIGEDKVWLTESSDGSYTGEYTVPNVSGTTVIGDITFSATKDYDSYSYDSGKFTAVGNTADYSSLVPVDTDDCYTSLYTQSCNFQTPYTNYGLGNAQYCEILKDFCESTPSTASDDKSCPLTTPLLRGTFDKITGVVTYDDEVMFVLACGKKVYAKETAVVDGYEMPTNEISAYSAVNTESSTDFYIHTNRLVPINAATGPQNYVTGTNGRPYAVNSLESSYIDFLFFDTTAVTGSFDLSGSKCVSTAQWLTTSDGNIVLRLNFANAGKFYGYSISTDTNGYYKISINNPPSGVKTVMLDPGHGGEDSGTYSVYPEIYEDDVNLVLAYKVQTYLSQMGYNVVMTRYGDDDLSLNERMLMGRTAPDIFVSIHCDGASSPEENGTHTFYYYNYSYPLAESIYSRLSAAYKSVYSVGTQEYLNIDKGTKFYPYQVTRIEECPSVLVECGYLTNVYDFSVLLSEDGQNLIAKAIANGIDDYFSTQ